MWRYALLGPALLATGSSGTPNNTTNANASISAVSISPSLQNPGYSVADVAPSLNTTTLSNSTSQASSSLTHPSIQFLSGASPNTGPKRPPPSINITSPTWNSHYPTASPGISTHTLSNAPYTYKNGTVTSTTSTLDRGSCTGCAIAAYNPVTTAYQSNLFGNWTSLIVTETILTEFVTYMDNSTIDTIVTELKTVNQTKTVDDITDTFPNFVIYLPTPGLALTMEVGPTYVIYTHLFGGPDAPTNATYNKLNPTQRTCAPHVTSLKNWTPTRTEDWNYFIMTINGTAPKQTVVDTPLPVPTKLVDFLAQSPEFQVQFQGVNINTCTLAGISEASGDPNRTLYPPVASTQPAQATATTFAPPAFSTAPGTNTYLSTTYASTSKHITKQGCLRCDTNPGDLPQTPKPIPQDPNTNKINDGPVSTPKPNPKDVDNPKSNDSLETGDNSQGKPADKSQDQPQNTPQNTPKPDSKTTPSVPDIINSIISENPNLTRKPQEQPADLGQTVTIGNSVVTIRPQPTQQYQAQPNQQSNGPVAVIIGTRTLTVGQTTTIDGVPVVVPTAGRGSTVVVGDKTIGLNPQITQAPMPVITVGHNTITANLQGQFVVGTRTLQRGGPALIVDDNTLTLGPSGKIAIINGATQTLVTMAGASGTPAVTFGGQPVTAEVIGGTTVYVLDGQTLAPGRAVTVDGTTFSLPPGFHGSRVVINGQTQRLSADLPVLTLGNSPITATVADGTTKFILAPGETLTPGGTLTISGTTYSLPTSGAGSTIIINGATTRLNPSHLPVLPPANDPVTATLAHGTTAFIFGPDKTLTPGGIVTVSGTTLSLPASASNSVIIINGVPSTFSNPGPVTSAPPIIVNGKTITATTRHGTTEYALNSATTLRPDGQILIDGTTYALAPGGTALVVNGATSVISSAPASNSASTTRQRGAGDFIASGIGEAHTSKGKGSFARGGGAVKVLESLALGAAGWLVWLV